MHQQAVSISDHAQQSSLAKIILLLIDEKPRHHDDVCPFSPLHGTMLRGPLTEGQRISFSGIEPSRAIRVNRDNRRFAQHRFSQNTTGNGPERQPVMGVAEGKP